MHANLVSIDSSLSSVDCFVFYFIPFYNESFRIRIVVHFMLLRDASDVRLNVPRAEPHAHAHLPGQTHDACRFDIKRREQKKGSMATVLI